MSINNRENFKKLYEKMFKIDDDDDRVRGAEKEEIYRPDQFLKTCLKTFALKL